MPGSSSISSAFRLSKVSCASASRITIPRPKSTRRWRACTGSLPCSGSNAPDLGLNSPRLAAEAGEEWGEIVADFVAEIAAFLDDDRRQAEPGDGLANTRKTWRRHREPAERIALEG